MFLFFRVVQMLGIEYLISKIAYPAYEEKLDSRKGTNTKVERLNTQYPSVGRVKKVTDAMKANARHASQNPIKGSCKHPGFQSCFINYLTPPRRGLDDEIPSVGFGASRKRRKVGWKCGERLGGRQEKKLD